MTNDTPKILRETNSGYTLHNILDEMLRRREIECVGEINAESVYSLTRQLRWLEQEDPNAEITMFINSPGGDVRSGLALYDIMKGLSCPVRTVCLGMAASMAAVLFAAGDRREIAPHGTVMIHDPLLPSGGGGSALQVEKTSKHLMKSRKELCEIIAQCTGKTLREVYRKTASDTYFNAEEAVRFGLADNVINKI